MGNVHNFSRNNESQTIRDRHVYNVCDVYVKVTKYLMWGEQNLGPCSGLKYHILPTIRPRRGNYKGTS